MNGETLRWLGFLKRALLIGAILGFFYLQVLFAAAPPIEWQKVTGPWDAVCDSSFTALAFHPGNSQTIYIGSAHTTKGCGIYKTTDGGRTWSAANNGLPLIGLIHKHYPAISKIAIAPSEPDTLYVGTVDSLSLNVMFDIK